MRYIKIFIITLIVTVIMEFLSKFLLKKYGTDKTLSIIKMIAVVCLLYTSDAADDSPPV